MLIPPWLAWLAPDRVPDTGTLDERAWEHTLAQAVAHHMAPALCVRLETADALARVPGTVREELLRRRAAAGFDVMVWRRALGLVLPAFAAEGIVPVPYKGGALAFLVYAEPAMRPMSDLDFWIDAPAMPRACAVLEALGFQAREKADRPRALQARCDGEIPYAGHAVGVPLVELHWGVFPGEWLRRTTRIDRAALRARCRPARVLGHPVEVLAPEDHFIQVAVHAGVTHVFSQATVRCLLDLVVIAHQGLAWDTVLQRAREWGLSRIVAHALALAGDLFDRPEFRDAALRLAGSRRLARLYGHIGPADVLAQRHFDAGLPKLRYLTAAVDSAPARWRLVARGLWPEPDWLGARYGRTGLRVRAAHLGRALRGRF